MKYSFVMELIREFCNIPGALWCYFVHSWMMMSVEISGLGERKEMVPAWKSMPSTFKSYEYLCRKCLRTWNHHSIAK